MKSQVRESETSRIEMMTMKMTWLWLRFSYSARLFHIFSLLPPVLSSIEIIYIKLITIILYTLRCSSGGSTRRVFHKFRVFWRVSKVLKSFCSTPSFFSPFPIHTRPFAFQWAIQLVSPSLQYIIICIIYIKWTKFPLLWSYVRINEQSQSSSSQFNKNLYV